MKNYAESIRAQLMKIANQEGVWFNHLITRYLHERLLYRLSQSQYTDNFCLKGGALFYALEGITARPTKDLDLLGRHVSNDPAHLQKIFLEILALDFQGDGVMFDGASIETTEIVKQGNYKGTRLTVVSRLGQIREKIQIDIGFGDRVIPFPIRMRYPTLLDMPSPDILTYSVETVIAEKFHAMINLGELNSRMKDFYDIFRLLQSEKYDTGILSDAISETFKTRSSEIPTEHAVLLPEFGRDTNRQKQWEIFLMKSRLEPLNFTIIHMYIINVLQPIIQQLNTAR
jgi:predicted nucleotidyltransferase component of viral defense system